MHHFRGINTIEPLKLLLQSWAQVLKCLGRISKQRVAAFRRNTHGIQHGRLGWSRFIGSIGMPIAAKIEFSIGLFDDGDHVLTLGYCLHKGINIELAKMSGKIGLRLWG